jgi:hypothetical protein
MVSDDEAAGFDPNVAGLRRQINGDSFKRRNTLDR